MCSTVLDIDHAWSEGLVPQVACSGYESWEMSKTVADMRSFLIGYSGVIILWRQ
jgi:hypothetical protein